MKKILALLLAAVLCMSLLAACAKNEDAQQDDTNESAGEENTEQTEQGENTEESEEPEEIVEITMAYLDLQGKGEGAGDMVAALNEITEKEIGVHVNVKFFNLADYPTQITLMMTGGETLDVIVLSPIPGSDYATLMANSQLLDIAPYLTEENAPAILESVGQYLDAFTRDGGIYGLPAKRDMAASSYINMRADLLEEMGMLETAANMTTWEEFEELLYAVKEAYPDIYPIVNGDSRIVISNTGFLCDSYASGGAFASGVSYDTVGDTLELIAYTDEDGVMSIPSTTSYQEQVALVAKWAEEGLLYPDAGFTDETGRDLLRNNVGFSFMCTGEGQIESDVSQVTGYPIKSVAISDQMITTAVITTWGTAVTVNADEPEAAVKFMNLLYENADAVNLLTYGIQDVDYTLTEDGEAAFDVASCNWHGSDWLCGNMFLTLPQAGTGADYRSIRAEVNAEAEISSVNGFSLDTSNLSDLLASLTSVQNEYRDFVRSGGYNESILQEYQDALQSAGIDQYVEEIQTQLDAWKAAK